MISFAVLGLPVGQGSKRVVRGRVIDANATRLRPWRQAVSAAAWDARHDAGTDTFTGPVEVRALFTFPRPKHHYRAQGRLRDTAPGWVAVRPDIDKLARALLDGLTGVLVRDDAQVARLVVEQRYAGAEPPGCEVTVCPL